MSGLRLQVFVYSLQILFEIIGILMLVEGKLFHLPVLLLICFPVGLPSWFRLVELVADNLAFPNPITYGKRQAVELTICF